jgi:hypothetical protein
VTCWCQLSIRTGDLDVPLAAQSRLLPLPYSAPARMMVGVPSSLYLGVRRFATTAFEPRQLREAMLLVSRVQRTTHSVRSGARKVGR